MNSYHHALHHRKYSEKYDAVYCADCDEWLEGKCPDAECEFCSTRPEKPSAIAESLK
jgi:hypothetical protein